MGKSLSKKDNRREYLEKRLALYEKRLRKKLKMRGEIERTRFGDSYQDQVRDDTNVLTAMIDTIKEEIYLLKDEV